MHAREIFSKEYMQYKTEEMHGRVNRRVSARYFPSVDDLKLFVLKIICVSLKTL